MNLQQGINDSAYLLCLVIEYLQNFEAVYSMYQMNEGCKVFDLIGLDVPNHVPFYVGGETFGLAFQILNAVFAKSPLSGRIGFENSRIRLGFADRDQGDLGREASLKRTKSRGYFHANKVMPERSFGSM